MVRNMNYSAFTVMTDVADSEAFKGLSHQGTREMPDGMYVTDRTFVYECQVLAFGRFKMIRLYYGRQGLYGR